MSSIQRASSFKPISFSFDEHRWVTQIRRTLEEELEDYDKIPVSIFNVPKVLMATDPKSYTPQEVAIGPYHYRQPELYEMERYKLSAAKRIQKKLQNHKFHDIVEQLTKHEPTIRACYHKYLELSGETLAWMMAIDASFLLEFLQVYAIKQGKEITLRKLSSRMSHLLDYTGQKLAHYAILRDIIMLENQIPLFVLRKMLEFQFLTLEEADDTLFAMLLGFCQELSPFKMIKIDPSSLGVSISDCAHLLDFLYEMVTPKIEEARRHHEAIEIVEDNQGEDQGIDKEVTPFSSSNSFRRPLRIMCAILLAIWRTLKKLNFSGPVVNLIKSPVLYKPLKVFLKMPWKIVSNIPGLRILKTPVAIFLSQNKEEIKPEDDKANRPPLIEEIEIPSVTVLSKSGVNFCPTNGNLLTIAFDTKTVTFHLPTISLDVNTEAILRNLVAYEASNASGPLVFTRYTELMNGIIDTEEDVRLLREKGIILNRLKSDKEVANLWNGMSKSIRLTKVPFLDRVIEDVNKYHNKRWKAKFGKFMKRYVFGSWRLLTLLAAILMLLLMGLQAFCSVYSCARVLNVPNSN